MSMIVAIVLLVMFAFLAFAVGITMTNSFFGALWFAATVFILGFDQSWWWVLLIGITAVVLAALFEVD